MSAAATPVVFVHGNASGRYVWDGAAEHLRDRGYGDRELHRIDFSGLTPSHTDMARELDDFVESVIEASSADQVDIVSHSLGVTGARWWMFTRDGHERVRRFVGLAGANHGLTPATYAARFGFAVGPWASSAFLRDDYHRLDNHPLQLLNSDETFGDVRYFTVRGSRDTLFALDPASPRLCGAEQNAVVGAGHVGVIDDAATLQLLTRWLE